MKEFTLSRRLCAVTMGLLLSVGGAWADGVNLLQYITAEKAAANDTYHMVETGNKTYPTVTKNGEAIEFTTHETYLKLNLTDIDVTLGNGQVYLAVEMSNAYNPGDSENSGVPNRGTNYRKVNLTVNGTATGNIERSKGNLRIQGLGTYGSTGTTKDNIMAIVCALADDNTTLYNMYLSGEPIKLTSFTMEFTVPDAIDMTIKRLGFYTLGELANLYSDLTSSRFTFNPGKLDLNKWNGQTSSGSNTIKLDKNTDEAETDDSETIFNLMQMRLRAIGNMPTAAGGTWTIDLCRGSIGSGTVMNYGGASPVTEDLFQTKTGVIYEIMRGSHKLLPTPTQGIVRMAYWSHYDCKDGSTPNGLKPTGTQSRSLYDYTRDFKEGYNSCIVPFAFNVSDLPSALTAYIFTSADGNGKVTFTKATGSVAANTPMIIKCSAAGLYVIPGKDTTGDNNTPLSVENYYETDVNGIKFVGSYVQKNPCTDDYTDTDYDCYGISADGTSLVKMAGAQTSYYRAFLAVKKNNAGSRSLSIGFDDDNEPTGIKAVNNIDTNADGIYYNLSGQRVAQPTKGLYIVNGKKVIMK
ncbi:MAG: hypothetical protein ILA25_02255 [Prevotella sp.]|nr:hypothetical protein [Prevotella sp.]